MNRAALSAALELVTELGLDDRQVGVASNLSDSGTRLTAWMDRGVDRARVLALLGEPEHIDDSLATPIARWTRDSVLVEVWDWPVPPSAKCPTCGKAGAP